MVPPKHPQKTSGIEKFLAIFLIVILSIGGITTLAELIVGVFFLEVRGPHPIETKLTPNIKPLPYTMFGDTKAANFAHPLQSTQNDPLAIRTDEDYRIFFLGKSTAPKEKLPGELVVPIPQQLEKKFHDSGYSNVKVYDYGSSFSVSGQFLARLVHEITELNPDLVIMYGGAADTNSQKV